MDLIIDDKFTPARLSVFNDTGYVDILFKNGLAPDVLLKYLIISSDDDLELASKYEKLIKSNIFSADQLSTLEEEFKKVNDEAFDEEDYAIIYFDQLNEKYKNKLGDADKKKSDLILEYAGIIGFDGLRPKHLLAFKHILQKNDIIVTKENVNRVRHAKKLGIKVKHLVKMENELNADISRVEKMSLGGANGEKFKLIVKDREDTTRKQKKFIKVQERSQQNMTFDGDRFVKDAFLGQNPEHILIPDHVHISKKPKNTSKEFVVTDFAERDTKIFLPTRRSSYLGTLNPELSNPEKKQELSEQLILSLKQLHDKGIYHYDFKPDNVLLNENGTVRITDLSTATNKINGVGSTSLPYSPPEYFDFLRIASNKSIPIQEKRNACNLLDREKHDVWSLSISLLNLQVGQELNLYRKDPSLPGAFIFSLDNQNSINNYIDNLNIDTTYKTFFKSVLICDPSKRPNLDTLEKNFQEMLTKQKKQKMESLLTKQKIKSLSTQLQETSVKIQHIQKKHEIAFNLLQEAKDSCQQASEHLEELGISKQPPRQSPKLSSKFSKQKTSKSEAQKERAKLSSQFSHVK
ncbi:MAG: hypothetical protein LBJ32_02035 [Oscillospiraceae bacterium]|nr:hypothetical protein [Oscillospiraceae bacterium]